MADNMTTLQILQGIHDWVLDKIDEETANFITKTVNDLVNYYTKSETYTKAEVQQIVDAIKQFTYEVVQVLPTASASTMNKIYLVPAPKSEDKNVKEEYITIQNGSTYSWEMLGTTSIDLSNYYTKGQTDSAISSALSSALASYTTTTDLTTLLAQKQDVIQDLAAIRSGASTGATAVQPSTLNSALSDTVAESGVYDVTANNNNAKFASLSALLGSENLDTLIPSAKRKGGMSIKFVQSSDNNYVQCRLMADEFTTDTTQWAIAEEGVYVENPEFVYVKADKDGKILWAIKTDGGIYYGAGIPQQVVDYIEKKIADLSLDEYEDIVAFLSDYLGSDTTLKAMIDGINAQIATKVDKVEGKSLIDAEYASSQSAIENPEFMEVELDANNKILGGRKNEGTKFENIGFETPVLNVDGASVENVKDPEERIEVNIDSKKRILNYRDKDGVLHENIGFETPAVTTNSLNLTEDGMTDFMQALNNAGYQPNVAGNWSESENIELPEPKGYALLNLVINSLPLQDADVSEGYVEYYDKSGNYFKLTCELTAQGQTSKIFAQTGGKGNYTLDLPKDIKFGDWVPQDSYHLKGCAKDVTRGYLATCYKWAYMMQEYLDCNPCKVLMDESSITVKHATGDRVTDWPIDARCLPDGFPIEVYINGEYWGLYALQLKKHRKNYQMDKKDYTSLIIDAANLMPNGNNRGFWIGEIPWNMFEVRGPKDLVCMDGSAYDGDDPKELIDSTSPNYDSTNSKHVGSAQAKAIIESFSTKYLAVKTLVDTGTVESLAQAKSLFADYFDVDACILVYIFNCLMNNSDSVKKNTLWGTWKNGKVAPMLWDLDGVYGEGWIGTIAWGPSDSMWTGSYSTAAWPLALLWTLYETEIKAAYSELRQAGIIDIKTWKDIIYNKWVNRIGVEAYQRDIKKWPETPSYRKDMTNTEYWFTNGLMQGLGNHSVWDEETNYSVGDEVALPCYPNNSNYLIYSAVKASIGVCPVTKYYTGFPQIGGYYNSPKRMEKWMIAQIDACDQFIGYNE